jgi:hypothetical protein
MNNLKKYKKMYYLKNKEILLDKARIYRNNNKEKIAEYKKSYYQKYKKDKSIYDKKYRLFNTLKIKERSKKYVNNRRKNIMIKLAHNFSNDILKALKRNKNGYSWELLVNYTLDDLKKNLETQFTDGMNWQNQGLLWHIDHKIPNSWFKYEKPDDEEFKLCWALENLKPMIGKYNLEKSNKFAEPTDNQQITCFNILKRKTEEKKWDYMF